MYTNNKEFKNALCEYCADPATVIKKIKASYWPYETISLRAYCYECYQEVCNKKLPMVTDPTTRSRKGNQVKNRNRLKDELK